MSFTATNHWHDSDTGPPSFAELYSCWSPPIGPPPLRSTTKRRRSSRLMRLNHLCPTTSTHNQMTKRLSNGVTIRAMSPCASHSHSQTTNSQRDLFRRSSSSFNCEFGSVSINFRISTCSLKHAETAENSRNRFIIEYHLHSHCRLHLWVALLLHQHLNQIFNL